MTRQFWLKFILHHLATSIYKLSIWHSINTHGSVCKWSSLQSAGESSCSLSPRCNVGNIFPFWDSKCRVPYFWGWSSIHSGWVTSNVSCLFMLGVDSIDIPIVYPSYTRKVWCSEDGTHPLPQPKRASPLRLKSCCRRATLLALLEIRTVSVSFCCCTPGG